MDFRRGAFQRNGVSHHKFLECRVLNLFNGVATQHGVGNHGTHGQSAVLFDEVGSLADSGTCVDDVVQQDNVFASHLANKAHLTDFIGFVAMLVAHHETVAQRLGIHTCTTAAAQVRRSKEDVVDRNFHRADVRHKERRAEEVVNGNVEEALYLVSMEVHGDDTVHTGCRQHGGNQLGGNGDMGFVLAVLTSKTIIRNNGDNLVGRGTTSGVDHHQQLEEVVGRRNGRLDDEDLSATDGLFVRRLEFTISILENSRVSKSDSIFFSNTLSEVFRCTTRENEYFTVIICTHCVVNLDCKDTSFFNSASLFSFIFFTVIFRHPIFCTKRNMFHFFCIFANLKRKCLFGYSLNIQTHGSSEGCEGVV